MGPTRFRQDVGSGFAPVALSPSQVRSGNQANGRRRPATQRRKDAVLETAVNLYHWKDRARKVALFGLETPFSLLVFDPNLGETKFASWAPKGLFRQGSLSPIGPHFLSSWRRSFTSVSRFSTPRQEGHGAGPRAALRGGDLAL